jgi:ribonuclease HI
VEDGKREEISGGELETTNNRMELTAVIEALRRVPTDAPVKVVTDSQYVLKGITSWLAGWQKRGWRTATGQPVVNRDLWEALAALVDARVTWEWVRGHSGHRENTRVDQLARRHAQAGVAARRERGAGLDLPSAVERNLERGLSSDDADGARAEPLDALADRGRPRQARADSGRAGQTRAAARARGNGASKASSGGWPTYLSLVDGRLMRHHDWPSCEQRVHGRSGARFKKCRSADEERATVAGWKLPAAALASLGEG